MFSIDEMNCDCKFMIGRFRGGLRIPSASTPGEEVTVAGMQICLKNRQGEHLYPCPYTTAGAAESCTLGYEAS